MFTAVKSLGIMELLPIENDHRYIISGLDVIVDPKIANLVFETREEAEVHQYKDQTEALYKKVKKLEDQILKYQDKIMKLQTPRITELMATNPEWFLV